MTKTQQIWIRWKLLHEIIDVCENPQLNLTKWYRAESFLPKTRKKINMSTFVSSFTQSG